MADCKSTLGTKIVVSWLPACVCSFIAVIEKLQKTDSGVTFFAALSNQTVWDLICVSQIRIYQLIKKYNM